MRMGRAALLQPLLRIFGHVRVVLLDDDQVLEHGCVREVLVGAKLGALARTDAHGRLVRLELEREGSFSFKPSCVARAQGGRLTPLMPRRCPARPTVLTA